MQVEIKFNLDDVVKLLPLSYKDEYVEGLVRSIIISHKGIHYECRFFNDGQPIETMFLECELEKIK